MPLHENIKKFINNNKVRLHMPGHKGGPVEQKGQLLPAELFIADVTEVPEADDLHNPTGAIAESEEIVSSLFNSKASFYLINGATAGILASFLYSVKPDQKVLIPRHSHKAVLSALILTGAEPVYLPLDFNEEYGIPLGINRKALTKSMEKIAVRFNVRPTYQGVVDTLLPGDDSIIQIVDEAHGGHLKFSQSLPDDALTAGGDLVIQGTHKTLGSLTQTGLLHISKKINKQQIRTMLSLVQSTSPSYILLLSLETMAANLVNRGREQVENCVQLAQNIREKINEIKDFCCLTKEDVFPRELDATKLVFYHKKLSGYELSKVLREDYKIELEMATDKYVIAMITLNDTTETANTFIAALKEINERFKDNQVNDKPFFYPTTIPPLKILPRQALYAAKRSVKIEEAQGLICAETFCPYPPGIPIIYPGELITQEVRDFIIDYRKTGGHWQGCIDPELKTIQVIS